MWLEHWSQNERADGLSGYNWRSDLASLSRSCKYATERIAGLELEETREQEEERRRAAIYETRQQNARDRQRDLDARREERKEKVEREAEEEVEALLAGKNSSPDPDRDPFEDCPDNDPRT